MKRRDWKIKKLKKNTFDNFYKRKRIFFLRKLFLRKNLVFLKKNLIPNYFIYGFILKNFKYKKYFHIKNTYNYKNVNGFLILPTFFYVKKVFNYYINAKFLFNKNNLDCLFLNKIFHKNYYFKGNTMFLFNRFNDKLPIFLDSGFESEKLEKNSIEKMFSLKYNCNEQYTHINNCNNDFSFFLNYNIYCINSNEIYKILILLYIFKLN